MIERQSLGLCFNVPCTYQIRRTPLKIFVHKRIDMPGLAGAARKELDLSSIVRWSSRDYSVRIVCLLPYLELCQRMAEWVLASYTSILFTQENSEG